MYLKADPSLKELFEERREKTLADSVRKDFTLDSARKEFYRGTFEGSSARSESDRMQSLSDPASFSKNACRVENKVQKLKLLLSEIEPTVDA